MSETWSYHRIWKLPIIRRTRRVCAVVGLAGFLIWSTRAEAVTTSLWNVTNRTGGPVSDFEGFFRGTDANIMNAKTVKDAMGTTSTTSGSSNLITIT